MQRSRDPNELAFRILRAALLPTLGRKGDPRMRTAAAMRYAGLEATRFTSERAREVGAIGNAVVREKWKLITADNLAMASRPKNLDPSQLAKRILDEATGDEPQTAPPSKNQAAVELGRRGGNKGGAARKAALTPERRKEIASGAAKKRWQDNQ